MKRITLGKKTDDKTQKNIQKSLYSQKILEICLNNAEVGLYVSDFWTGEILFVNQKFASLSQRNPEDMLKEKCWNIINNEQKKRCPFCPYKKLIDEDGNLLDKYKWELYIPSSDMWIKAINQAIEWVDGRLAHMVTFYDNTEAKKIQSQLENLAFIDRQLQLKNEFKLVNHLDQTNPKPSLVIFHLLSLKKINDVYGRNIGNRLLLSVRDWLASNKIPNSDLYRIGGDKLCLTVCSNDLESLRELAVSLYSRFDTSWTIENGGSIQVIFCDISTVVIPETYITGGDATLNLIERTLSSTKNTGKVTFYNEEYDKDFRKRLQMEISMKKCVMRGMDGFDVYYQPIADPTTGTWCGLEALCRWNSPELGAVSPLTFIPEAERLNLIGSIELWVLKKAISMCKKWNLDKHSKFILDINFSADQFLDETLLHKILKTLKDYDFPEKKLCIEITESTRFTFTDVSLNTIEQLRANSIQVALDDFGTGYSSFNNLRSLPVNILKIERVFVSDIENDSYQQYLFHVMAELAHVAGMKLIAEGVESKRQMEVLLENGADLLQGYLFSRPLPSNVLESHLNCFYDKDERFAEPKAISH